MNLTELREAMNQFLTSAIETKYNQWESPKDLNPIANKLIEAIKEYVEESDADTKREQHKD